MAVERIAPAETTSARKEIVGREEELERISAFVETYAGRPAALVLEGDPGIGKTTLWRAATQAFEASGSRVLKTTPAFSEAALALSTLVDLLEPVYGSIRSDLPAPQRHALDVALAMAEPERADSLNDRLLRAATRSALHRLAERGPVVVAIDDLQWVDDESAAALSYALRRLDEDRVHCVFALRLGTSSSVDLAQLGELAVERITVGPLSLGATQRLLSNEVGVAYARTIMRRLVETSGGNPFYALELALALERGGPPGPSGQPALSERLDDLISARLGIVSPAAQELLGLLSLVPSATMAEIDALEALGGLDECVAAGIVVVDETTVRFAHPLLAAGAYARLGPEERRRRHAALAATLDDPVERARHLAHASLEPSAAVADELTQAAALASSRGLPGLGADLAEHAARLTPEEDERRRVERRLLAADGYVRAGNHERARELLDVLMPCAGSGDERAWALRLRASVTGDIASQRELLLLALEEARDPSISAEVNALLVRNYLYTGDLQEALAAARAGDEQAGRTGDTRRIAAATTTLGLMQIWGTGVPEPNVFERARALVESGAELPADTYSNPQTLIGARALYRYELDQARRSYTLGAAAADAAGEVDSLETFWWGLAQLEVRAGRYSAAHEYADRMRESGETVGRRPLSVRWLEGLLAVYDGRVDDARVALDGTIAQANAGGNWFFDAYGRAALALLELSLDAPGAAVAALESVLETPFVLQGDPGQTGVAPLAAEALVLAGELDRAASVLAHLETRGRELEHRWCLANAGRCRGLLLLEREEFHAAFSAFEDALALHDDVSAPFERARTMLALGIARRRARQRRAARESLEQAEAAFEELGTPLWLAKARTELSRIGGRAPSRGELTANERRIAVLVGEGKTNKEVAAALFVTDRTVESALTQIYRKLSVRSRTELARKLAEHS